MSRYPSRPLDLPRSLVWPRAVAGIVLILSIFAVRAGALMVQGVEIDDVPFLGPCLLPTPSPSDSIRIAFRGTTPETIAAKGTLRFGFHAADEKEISFEAAPSHVLEHTGLQPSTVYHYQLTLGDSVSPVYRFRTAPAPGTRAEELRVLILSDFHVHSPRDAVEKPTSAGLFFRRYAEKADDMRKFAPDLILLPGDIVHVGERRDQYETLLRLMRDLFATAVVLPCPGNHERQKDPKLLNYTDFFPDPAAAPQSGAWALNYGGIGFVTHGAAPWIQSTISRFESDPMVDTIFYTLHAPIYLWSDKDTSAEGNRLSAIFDGSSKTRLCISGHYHMHQRTFPLMANAAASLEVTRYGPKEKGTIYLQIPSVWYQYATATADPLVAHNGSTADGLPFTGFAEMTITPAEIITKTFGYSERSRHELIDQFTIVRP